MAIISSSYALSYNSQRIIQTLKYELALRQKEIGTGRKSDLAVSLGSQLKSTFNKRAVSGILKEFLENNQAVQARIDITQSSLSHISENAEVFKSTLILAQNDARGQNLIVAQASNFLNLLISTLNNSIENKYIFAGEKTDITPVNNFFTTPTSQAKSAIDAAFSNNPPGGFGFTQGSSQVSSITPQQLEDFISGPLTALFSENEWSLAWSNANTKPLINKISPVQQMATSVTSNDPALRKIAMAYVMAGNLGAENMNPKTYQTLARRTTEILDEGIKLLNSTRARVGAMKQSIESANTALRKQSEILDIHLIAFEGVDQTEVAARTSSLLNQIEACYTLTSRISKLSLVQYI